MLFADDPKGALTGIARLAAEGERLAAKRRVEYVELPTRRYITRCDSERVPFEWTVNPYRGCEFGCKYCYARYTHEFMELREPSDFETKIFAKQWRPAAFREELGKVPLRDSIAIGTATDPYQPAERRYGITRAMLGVLAKEQNRKLSIVTKSDLIVRDLSLLAAIAKANILHVAVTITTLDEKLARLLEPYAPRPDLRLAAVRALSGAGLMVGVLACPILPLINDRESALDTLARAAARAGAVSLAGNVLFLKPCTHSVFFPFLAQHFPHLVRRYRERYETSAFVKGAYPMRVAEVLDKVRAGYGLSGRFPDYRPDGWAEEPQMELPFEGLGGPRTDFSSKSTC